MSKARKNLISFLFIMIFSVCLISLFFFESNAFSKSTKSYVKIASSSAYIESGETLTIPFKTTKRRIFVMKIEIDDCNRPTEGGFKLQLKNSNGKLIQNDKVSLEDYSSYYHWFYSDGFFQKAGKYNYYIKNTSDEDWKVKYTLVSYSKIAKKASMKKSVSGKRGDWIKIGKVGPGYPAIKSIKFSNKKIVKYYDNAYDGNIYIMGKNRGTTNVTLKLKNGKKYTTKVTFKPTDDFSFFAYIYDYDSRNNYIKVKVKNNGPRAITFVRSGANLRNDNYKFYDRKIKSSGNITVKPGKTKYIRFYIKGDYVWDDLSNHSIFSKIRYDGMTFKWQVRTGSTYYKKNNKWYCTYYSKYAEDYEDWY